MLKRILEFISLCVLLIAPDLHAQVTVTICPDLKSDISPTVKLGAECSPSPTKGCGTCNNSSCEVAFHDPIGGFAFGYYLFKDKESDRFQLQYETGMHPEEVKNVLNRVAEDKKHKLQDKKLGPQAFDVPINQKLLQIGDELQQILSASYRQFADIQTWGEKPDGDLQFVFSTITIRDAFVKLSVAYESNRTLSEITEVLFPIVTELLPRYEATQVGDSVISGSINPEYPSFEIKVDPRAKTIVWEFAKPRKAEGPNWTFDDNCLRKGRNGVDTLLSSRLKNGEHAYLLQLNDESEIKTLREGAQEIALLLSSTGSIAAIPSSLAINNTEHSLTAEDVHGNLSTRRLLFLQYENAPPKFLVRASKAMEFEAPEDVLYLDKYNHRFTLHGRIDDASPIRYVRINGVEERLNEQNEFTHALSAADHGKIFKVQAVDALGNRMVPVQFRVIFKESGVDRDLKPFCEESYSASKPEQLEQNGMHGLDLQIKADKFYIKKLEVADTVQSAEASDMEAQKEQREKAMMIPFVMPHLAFSKDFELQVSYSAIVESSRYFMTFGMDDGHENYFFIYGEGTKLYLGQCENNTFLGNSGNKNAYGSYGSIAEFNYLQSANVTSGFFTRGFGTEFILRIKRYNGYYIGGPDAAQDWLFIDLDNSKDEPVHLQMPLEGSKGRILGTRCGIAVWKDAHIAVDQITFKSDPNQRSSVLIEDKDIEKACFETCYAVDSTRKKIFFDCLTTEYKVLIVANGDFNGRIANLPQTVARGKKLKELLVSDYQFPEESVRFMPNATKESFLTYLEHDLPKNTSGDTKLLIWVISHGTTDKTIEFVDAPFQSDDIWTRLRAKDASGQYKIGAQQVLLVLDACYSGKMTPETDIACKPGRDICGISDARSRLVITAADDPTRESLLTQCFIDQLTANPDRFVTIDKLYDVVKRDFLKRISGVTEPAMTIFDRSEHDSNGSFLFIKKKFFQ